MGVRNYFGFRPGDIVQASPGHKRSRGETASLFATRQGVIEHYGDTKIATADYAGTILVRQGVIADEVKAVRSGRVHGQVADKTSVFVAGAFAVLAGSPKKLEVYGNGSALVFGSPEELIVDDSNATIVTPHADYHPEGDLIGNYTLTYLLPPDGEDLPVVRAPQNVIRSFESLQPLLTDPDLLVIQGLFAACNQLTFTPDGERYF